MNKKGVVSTGSYVDNPHSAELRSFRTAKKGLMTTGKAVDNPRPGGLKKGVL